MKLLTRARTLYIYILALMLCIGCEQPVLHQEFDWATAPNANRNPYGQARRLEMPRLDAANLYNCYTTKIQGQEVVTFSIEYDTQKRHAKWVAFTFDNQTAQTHWNRNNWEWTEWEGDPFQPDPLLPHDVRIGDEEHRRDRYDRGHLCASADRLYSKDSNEQTFYYSNISPQLNGFNAGIWLDLENKVQQWGSNSNMRDTLYVVKGGTIRDGEYYDSRGQHGSIVKDIRTMNGIVVPAHFFMALVCRKSDSFYGIAFYFDHKERHTGSLSDYAITIDELEELTGIDYYCNFPDKVEEAIESKCNPTLWGLQ
ncbi:MAG: DNA/RNA non-specific endonuclease [Bacteroidaceae bacterium]|nr:DNA/RNA non-specific endonuclease [Bacteroidaceae bacterium]